MATQASTRTSFFDDDDLNIKFEWEKLDKGPFRDALKHNPFLRDTLTRSQTSSSSLIQGYFLLYQRCIIQFKVTELYEPVCYAKFLNYLG